MKAILPLCDQAILLYIFTELLEYDGINYFANSEMAVKRDVPITGEIILVILLENENGSGNFHTIRENSFIRQSLIAVATGLEITSSNFFQL